MHRLLSSMCASRGDLIVLSLDIKNASSSTQRPAVVAAMESRCSALLPLAEAWLRVNPAHLITGTREEGSRFGTQFRGQDQECPLSPGLFAATVANALDIAQTAMRVIDREAMAPAYLDDSYLVGTGEAVKTGLRAFVGRILYGKHVTYFAVFDLFSRR